MKFLIPALMLAAFGTPPAAAQSPGWRFVDNSDQFGKATMLVVVSAEHNARLSIVCGHDDMRGHLDLLVPGVFAEAHSLGLRTIYRPAVTVEWTWWHVYDDFSHAWLEEGLEQWATARSITLDLRLFSLGHQTATFITSNHDRAAAFIAACSALREAP